VEWDELLQGEENDLPVFRYDYGYDWSEPDPDWDWLRIPTSWAYDTLFPPFISRELLRQNDPVWIPTPPT